MICGTCGCNNPGQLVFCQECGQRLGPRVAAPTPPIGVGPGAGADPKSPTVCSRCAAENQPGVRYCVTCGNVLIPPQSAGLPPPSSVAAPPATVPAPPLVVPPPESARAPLPVATPIVPAAVYQVVAARVEPPPVVASVASAPSPTGPTSATRVCPRCRGTSDDQAQFCRFCGAVLSAPAPTATGPAGAAVPSKVEPAIKGAAPRILATANEPQPQPPRPVVPVSFPIAQSQPVLRTSLPEPAERRERSEPASTVARALSPLIATPVAAPVPALIAALAAPAAPTVPPAKASFGRIVIITKEGGEGTSYPIYERLDIGRTEGEVILAEDRYLSPRHARLLCRVEPGKPATLSLIDLDSTNGIYLRLGRLGQDGAREVTLEDQDLFLVGQQVLKFDVVRDAEEGLGPATQHGTLLFGTPSVPRYARLSQRTVEGVTRDVFYVQKAETVLGRESGDIVFTDDPFLSRRHAALKFDAEAKRFVLSDLGSSNGTFVQIRGQVTIKSGDQFRIGQQLFRVDLSAAPAP